MTAAQSAGDRSSFLETSGISLLTQAQTLAEAFAYICLMDAPLNVRLAAYVSKLRELNFPFAEAYDGLVARLYTGEVGHAAPSVGDAMPPFILPSGSGLLVSLDDLMVKGPVVISFNRGHWCPFCKIELRAISEYHSEIKHAGAQAVSIMPDRQCFTGDLRAMTDGSILILTDIDNGYALSLGVVTWVGENLKMLMQGRGYHLDAFHGNDGWFLPSPPRSLSDEILLSWRDVSILTSGSVWKSMKFSRFSTRTRADEQFEQTAN